MTCKCGSTRLMLVYGKCNDVAGILIKHLDFDYDGYLPYIGVIGGSEIHLNICMDCGTVQGWEPVTDKMIKGLDEYKEEKRRKKREEEREAKRLAERQALAGQPTAVFSMVDVYVKKYYQILVGTYGEGWQSVQEAQELIADALASGLYNGPELQAIQNISKEFK